MNTLTSFARVIGAGALLASVGCGGRPEAWDASFSPGLDAQGNNHVAGLEGSVAVLDPALNQVMMITSPEHNELAVKRLPVGRNVVRFVTSPTQDRLFVLSRGVQPQLRTGDEPPQLMIFDGGVEPKEVGRYALQDPYEQLEIDPEGQWLIIHGSEGLVSNPNELILVEQGADRQISKTLDSYGGKPVRFTFTGELSVPGAEARRLLVVQREKDLAIIDLADPDAPEITVGLPAKASGGYASPAQVVYHDTVGELNAMLAVRLEGDSNVYLLTINEGTSADHALSLDANLVDVGGIPTTIDFVQTEKDGGLRLAALVPSKSAAMLIEPGSSTVLEVKLPQPFDKIQRITDDVSESSGEDIALLYGKTNTIAFWQLGTTTGTPYRSVDAYDISINVDKVLDIPGTVFPDRKILAGASTSSSQQFYVLDLSERKSFPLDVLKNLTLNLSPDGERLWAYDIGATGFAQLTFDPLQPTSLYTEKPIHFVHDFATAKGDTRSAIALHIVPNGNESTLEATLFDGLVPKSSVTKFYDALELEGIK
jgi:hypothetical protein